VNALLKKILLLALAGACVPAVWGDNAKPAAPKPAPVRSMFVMPASIHDGRDPFFPESSRPYEDAVASKRSVDATVFVIKGLSIVRGRAMVIINNHTFSLGDEGDVMTTSGRVHIKLAEIRPGVAVVEVNGAKREISIATK
jgi:hypothetical protein